MPLQDILDNDLVASPAPADRITLWRDILSKLQPATFAEIGVWKGEFARDILAACPSISSYYLLDPWATLPDWNKPFNVPMQRFEEIHAEALANTEAHASRRVVLRGRTSEVISRIPDGSLDFAYIDGDHSLRGITLDLQLTLPKIKAGGWIAGDDFLPTPWQHDSAYEPTLVFPYAIFFAEAMNIPIRVLPHGQFIMQVGTGAGFRYLAPEGAYRNTSLNRQPPPAPRKRRGLSRLFSRH